jgi:multicomponent Na+:H+ antiporter subunit A
MLVAVLSGFGVALAAPLVHRAARGASHWVLGLLPLGLFLYFLYLLPAALQGEPLHVSYSWIPSLGISMSFHADGLGLLFAMLISGIGFLVVAYSGGYLHGHPMLGRWYLYLLMFMASMLGVVLADNLIALFVFWELTSLTSYFLIGFNHEDEESRAAALQALLVTGAGGLAMMAGMVMMGMVGGSFELSALMDQGDVIRNHPLYAAIFFCILAGAVTKSAQFPFHYWLPNAMAAPTPASAYLHSSTMVKAGIYLLARLSPILGGTPEWTTWVTLVGAVTMLFGAWMALNQDVLKKLLAYSTVSALGAIVLLLGVGGEHAAEAAAAFIIAHALYKAALFMVAGSVDHETGERDVTRLGGLARSMPLTAAGAALAALSMSGVPLLFGFVAKEMLYSTTFGANGIQAAVMTAVAVLSSMFFVAVGCCVAYQPFYGAKKETPKHPHEVPVSMWLGPVLLGLCSIVFGVMPGLAGGLVSSASGAILGVAHHEVHLALWHGASTILGLSVVTLLGGLAAYRWRGAIREAAAPVQKISAVGPEQWYAWSLQGLVFTAKWQTKVIQNGYMRNYLLTILGTALLFTGYMLCKHVPAPVDYLFQHFKESIQKLHFYEMGLALILGVSVLMTMLARSRFAAIAALGVVGYGMSLIWVLFGAPDLAMTQFAIETLTVILFVLAFYHLPSYQSYSSHWHTYRDMVISAAVGGMVTILVLVASDMRGESTLMEYFGEHSYDLAHGHNIVNVILVDFRGIDTMGEITVLALAAIGAFALLKLRVKKREEAE